MSTHGGLSRFQEPSLTDLKCWKICSVSCLGTGILDHSRSFTGSCSNLGLLLLLSIVYHQLVGPRLHQVLGLKIETASGASFRSVPFRLARRLCFQSHSFNMQRIGFEKIQYTVDHDKKHRRGVRNTSKPKTFSRIPVALNDDALVLFVVGRSGADKVVQSEAKREQDRLLRSSIW